MQSTGYDTPIASYQLPKLALETLISIKDELTGLAGNGAPSLNIPLSISGSCHSIAYQHI